MHTTRLLPSRLLRSLTGCLALASSVACAAPAKTAAPAKAKPEAKPAAEAPPAPPARNALPRDKFNAMALRLNLPLYWRADSNKNGAVDADEVASLLFYPTSGTAAAKWVDGGKLTAAFDQALARMIAESDRAAVDKREEKLDAGERQRRRLVEEDLDQGRTTLVSTDLSKLSADERAFIAAMQKVTAHVDAIYGEQSAIGDLVGKVPADHTASVSLFRRNWGPRCEGPRTERNPQCTAIPGGAPRLTSLFPAALQKDPKYCEALEKHPKSKTLLDPFVVVREGGKGELEAVPYSVAYATNMKAAATALEAAAAVLPASEAPLKKYLLAAAQSFRDNNWLPADEAWAAMDARNSKWFVRVGPDETYWEPCNQKAGFHVTFALINRDSLAWQDKLTPLQNDMEQTIAKLIGKEYAARKVSFHLPDFIDIIWNAGDDRHGFGATIGQSLPNWGKVANEGRGRTVAMSNLYGDPDSVAARKEQAAALLTTETMATYSTAATPGLLSTILHEATHNLGPSHEYAYKGVTNTAGFGGGLASMLEELKAQSGGLFFVDYLVKKKIIDAQLAAQTFTDEIVWAFGHISRGMYTDTGGRKAYSQLAAIQVGFLMDEGAIVFDPKAKAANGTDVGAFSIKQDKMPAATTKLMALVARIKATNDKAGAEALAKKYVDSDRIPQKLITERFLRFPKASFVYELKD